VTRRVRRQIAIAALLLVKLVAMDFAFMPVAQALASPPVVTGVAGGVSHCHPAADGDVVSHPAHVLSAKETGGAHHGCHTSAACKCFCTHAPFVVDTRVVTPVSVPHGAAPSFASTPPGTGAFSVLFRPPI
jgi:hypothetical protein